MMNKFINYDSCIDFLYNQIPNYQKYGIGAINPGLKIITELCNILDNPQDKYKTIHIAGTNGKGSTTNILASIFQENKYKVGVLTSPHLLDFRERIKINGEYINNEFILEFVNKFYNDFYEIKASFFEWTTAMAFYYFYMENVDIAIIETGLGGKLDSTNIIKKPIASIITNISLEHTNFLGDRIEQIAEEKAGIIKENSLAIASEMSKNIISIFEKKCIDMNAKLFILETKNNLKLESDLRNNYQQKNLNLSYFVAKILNNKYGIGLNEDKIKLGLKNVIKNTKIQGRWQKISENEHIIIDVAHNPNGFENMINDVIEYYIENKIKKIFFVISIASDKNIDKILQLFNKIDIQFEFMISRVNSKRLIELEKIEENINNLKFNYQKFENPKSAYDFAVNNKKEDDMVIICGSHFLVSEIF